MILKYSVLLLYLFNVVCTILLVRALKNIHVTKLNHDILSKQDEIRLLNAKTAENYCIKLSIKI